MLTGETGTEIDRQMEEEKEETTDRESEQREETREVCVGETEREEES